MDSAGMSHSRCRQAREFCSVGDISLRTEEQEGISSGSLRNTFRKSQAPQGYDSRDGVCPLMSGGGGLASVRQHPFVSDSALGEMQRTAICRPNAHYDALVFGIGPAACIFAIQMARRDKTVLLVPPQTESSPK